MILHALLPHTVRIQLENFKRSFQRVPRALQLAWSGAPGWTITSLSLVVVQGVLPALSIVLAKYVVDAAVVAVEAGGAGGSLEPLMLYAALLVAVMLLTQILDAVARWVQIAQAEIVGDHLRAMVHRKSAEMDFAYYETAEYYDELYRVLEESQNRPLALLHSVAAFFRDAIAIVAVCAVLLPYGLWLPLVLVLSTIPAFLVLVRYNREYHNWWHSRTEDYRRSQYYDQVLTHGLTAAEVRVFGLRDMFQPAYESIRTLLRIERISLERRQVFARLIAALISLSVVAGTMVWIGWRVIQGAGTLGDLALFYQAFSRSQNQMRTLLGGVGQMHEHGLFLWHLFEFLDREPTIASPELARSVPQQLAEGITLNEVTFFYPGTKEPVLRDFNLHLPAGKVVAIVGENGAGKSTVFKLIARLYDPTQGSVEIDGIDIRSFDPEELRSRITALFQLPVNYHATAGESITMGDIRSQPDIGRMEQAAVSAGIRDRIQRLPRGYESQLGKWFTDGHELSGGEWQRLALARAFYRDAPILLLDEPTSRMDSWSEADWFERFRKYADGHTTLLITHRLTVARKADLVVVMKDGAIAEQGSHEELVARGGPYSQ
ncbi:MAG: ABC transporter ATP-binding protein, partial [Rubricoccaceae bacterium]|nr:ABC transporter ATP-binding protein [Rubricoccaceae bacterium]